MLLLQHLHVAGLREASRNLLPTFPGHRQLGRLVPRRDNRRSTAARRGSSAGSGMSPTMDGVFGLDFQQEKTLRCFICACW